MKSVRRRVPESSWVRAGQWACLVMSLVSLPAWAGPPFLTDDPEPVEVYHYEFYVASQQTLNADGRTGTAPQFEFNYGVAENVQLHVIAPYAFSSSPTGQTQRGYGDTELGVKYRLIQEGDNTPMVGIFPIVLAATGNSSTGLGNGKSQLYLPVWLQKSWGQWTSYGGGGYWINREVGARNNWFWGWQIQRQLNDQWIIGAELFHRTEQIVGQGDSSGFNIGSTLNLDEHNHLLLSIGRGLQNIAATNKVSSYLAYQFTY
jgi:hypothetical protein